MPGDLQNKGDDKAGTEKMDDQARRARCEAAFPAVDEGRGIEEKVSENQSRLLRVKARCLVCNGKAQLAEQKKFWLRIQLKELQGKSTFSGKQVCSVSD